MDGRSFVIRNLRDLSTLFENLLEQMEARPVLTMEDLQFIHEQLGQARKALRESRLRRSDCDRFAKLGIL